MSIHDSIADFLTIVRNGAKAGKSSVNVQNSKMTASVLKVLKKEHYIYDFKPVAGVGAGEMRVYLQPPASVKDVRIRKITRLSRISRPGLRHYAPVELIPSVLNGLGICIVSTSKGVMTGADARREKVGGEVLAKVW
jgi:small subunit ribosomal protein S8